MYETLNSLRKEKYLPFGLVWSCAQSMSLSGLIRFRYNHSDSFLNYLRSSIRNHYEIFFIKIAKLFKTLIGKGLKLKEIHKTDKNLVHVTQF